MLRFSLVVVVINISLCVNCGVSDEVPVNLHRDVLNITDIDRFYVEIRSSKWTDTSPCTTPNQKIGQCIPLNECKELDHLFHYSFREPAARRLLRSSQCGWHNSAPYVCCENLNSTPHVHNIYNESEFPSDQTPSIMEALPKCGNRSVSSRIKIVGGVPSELGAWPWMAALYCINHKPLKGEKKYHFQCGGSLISDQWVLTASHCLTCPKRTMSLSHVRLGDLDLNETVIDNATPVNVRIEKIVHHPGYKTKPLQNDIALLHLNKRVTFTTRIYPICLLSGEKYKSNNYYRKKKPFIAGWGSTEYFGGGSTRMMEVSIPMVDVTKCTKIYAGHEHEAVFDERIICAGDGKKDSCSGDSGGPLMFVNSATKTFHQGGVVSFGYKCANDHPGVYTKVAAFTDWISEVTGISF